ncbi:hypothetical protein SEA_LEEROYJENKINS_84 [Microbacterium phage LeeroyJenkins]|nr:hypothetical protein SEA_LEEROYJENKINS_84 [Microbacterium phage LeeroyJenkins]
MTYPKIIERPYKVYTGAQDYETGYNLDSDRVETVRASVSWYYDKSFELESDAEAYADRIAEDYEFVKIEKKENN